MTNDAKFWLSFTAIITIGVCVVIDLGTSYWKHHNNKIAELIEKGTDPVEVMCAMQNDYGNHPTCIVLATKAE